MEKKERIRRLLLDVTDEEHGMVKSRAALRGMSIKDYVRRAVIEQIKREKSYEQV